MDDQLRLNVNGGVDVELQITQHIINPPIIFKPIHSPRTYDDYIAYRKLFLNWYKDEICCGVDYETDWKWDKDGAIFIWRRDYFECKQCHYEVRVWNKYTDHDLSDKQLKEIVKHIQNNHFVLLRINQAGRSIIKKQENLIKLKRKLVKGDRFKHPLKPWQDPESLFCDTAFLEKFLGKKPTKGKECKDHR